MGDRYVLPESGNQPKSDFAALKQFVSARLTLAQSHRAETTIGSAQSVAVPLIRSMAGSGRHDFRG